MESEKVFDALVFNCGWLDDKLKWTVGVAVLFFMELKDKAVDELSLELIDWPDSVEVDKLVDKSPLGELTITFAEFVLEDDKIG